MLDLNASALHMDVSPSSENYIASIICMLRLQITGKNSSLRGQ